MFFNNTAVRSINSIFAERFDKQNAETFDFQRLKNPALVIGNTISYLIPSLRSWAYLISSIGPTQSAAKLFGNRGTPIKQLVSGAYQPYSDSSRG